MFLRKVIFSLFILVMWSAQVGAQIIDVDEDEDVEERTGSSILDDTTKQVYGPTTTQFTYLRNIKFNNHHYSAIDTSITNLHRYEFVTRQNRFYNNLGNVATPLNSIYPLVPDQIGLSSGFTLYDLLWRGPDDIKYYDTKSPFSSFTIIWGGQGRAITEAKYARNIDKRSGFGFDFRGLFIDKQIQRSGRGDRTSEGTYYNFFAHYATKNGKYKVLGNFIRNKHAVDEYGGILIDSTSGIIPELQYFDEDRQGLLDDVYNDELRTNYQLYHQYVVSDQIQLYHEYNRYKQQNDYVDVLDTTSTYFDFYEVDSADVKDRSKIVYNQQELGLKGDIGKTFYNFYYKYRNVDYTYKYLNADTISSVDTNVVESYGGFNLRFGNDSTSYVKAFGEYLQGGNFKLGGEIKTDLFYAKGITQKTTPAYIYQAYRGTHDVWVNDFESSITTKIEGGFTFNLGSLKLNPAVSNTLLSKYLYFREVEPTEDNPQTVLPAQTSSDINILSPSLGLEIEFLKHFKFKTLVIANNVSGSAADAVHLPDYFVNAKLSYGGINFEGNLEWEVGFDAFMKSSYFANGYDPAIMQFYVQDEFEVEAFPIVDFYVDAKINRGRIFFKVNNLYEIISDKGYFATPQYPGQKTILDFGVVWSFYD